MNKLIKKEKELHEEILMILNLIYVLQDNIEVRKIHNTDWLFINNVQTILLTQKQVNLIKKLKEEKNEF